VWVVAGDGGFQMTLQELAVHQAGARSADQDRHHQQRLPGHGAPVAAALLRQALHRHADLVSPDFVKLAAAYGIPGLHVTRPDEVIAAIEQANNTPGPFLIDFQVKEEVNVYPMVPPGAAVDH
jgi:acetolactate synthase-1/2/3 large subunit